MTGKIRASFLSMAIIMVLVFSAVRPINAYADDGTPSGDTTTEVTSTPEGGSTGEGSTEGSTTEEATVSQTTEESVPVEGVDGSSPTEGAQPGTDATPAPEGDPALVEGAQPSTDATPVPEGDPALVEGALPSTEAAPAAEGEPALADGTQPSTEAAPAEGEAATPEASILSEVPENTDVTVLDANGEVQSLATQDAADAIATSDPIWCPGAQSPTPGQNGCTPSFPSFDELLTFMSGNTGYQGAGTIYVQQGAYQGNDPNYVIDFNSPSYNLSNINNSNLTVTGGWNTSNNTVDPNTPTVLTNYSILIGSSANPWGGSLTLSNISIVNEGVPDFGAEVNGITLYSDQNVTVSNVSVTAASGVGAEIHAGGDANIRDSKFQQNVKGGAIVRAGGNVNVANSSFGNPFPDHDRWQEVGLDIQSGASTSLFGVIAERNRDAGVNINAGGPVTIGSSIFSSTMVMWDENGQTLFGGYGLQVVTPDRIELDDVTANNNFLWGAKLDAGGDIAIRNSVFNENTTDEPGFIDDTGLFITSKGDVSLDNVTASDNRLYGAQIDAAGTVSINNSTFNNNRGAVTVGGEMTMNGHGLKINSLSDIFINNTNAVGNMLFGGELQAGGAVAISNSNFSNTQTDDASIAVGEGLKIVSTGNVSLFAVILNNNQSNGADIQTSGDIYLDLVTAIDNATDGVTVQATCTHLTNGQYSGNGGYGLYLGNSALDVISPAIFINNTAGNIFPETPTSCAPPVINNPLPVTPVIENAGSSNSFAVSLVSGTTASEASKNVSLSSFLVNAESGRGGPGLFIGKYIYVHTDEGLLIFAYSPSSQQVAMANQ